MNCKHEPYSEEEEKRRKIEKKYIKGFILLSFVILASVVIGFALNSTGEPQAQEPTTVPVQDTDIMNTTIYMSYKNSTITTTDLAMCLAEKNITIYYTSTCPHCQMQMQLFGVGWNYLNKVNCLVNRGDCFNASISGVPTWVNGNTGEQKVGAQNLKNLADWCGFS